MVSNLNLELDFFKSKGNEYFKNLDYKEDIYIYNGTRKENIKNVFIAL